MFLVVNKKYEVIEDALKKHREKTTIIIESNSDNYAELNIVATKLFSDLGYNGIYVSFQRPLESLKRIFKNNNINLDNIRIIDVASIMSNEQDLEELDLDELIRKIYTELESLPNGKKFVFIDSLSTIALYKPLSEVMRFTNFLMHEMSIFKQNKFVLMIHIASELKQKKFIRDIAVKVDEILNVVE